VLAFFKLRRSDANVERPYKVHGGKAMGGLALVCGLLIAYFTFAYFTLDVWILFGVYYLLVAAIRVVLYFDDKSKNKIIVQE